MVVLPALQISPPHSLRGPILRRPISAASRHPRTGPTEYQSSSLRSFQKSSSLRRFQNRQIACHSPGAATVIKPTERLIEPAESAAFFIVGRPRAGQRRSLGVLCQGQCGLARCRPGVGAAAESTEDAPEPGVGAFTGAACPGPAGLGPVAALVWRADRRAPLADEGDDVPPISIRRTPHLRSYGDPRAAHRR